MFAFVVFVIGKDFSKAGMAAISVVYVLLPPLMERIFSFRIQTPLYFVISFYTVCPLLGYSYKLYYLLPWWDDILHAFAGVIFAMFGAYLPHAFCKNEVENGEKNGAEKVAFCAVFALVFSVAVAAVWEFIEFGTDCLFGTDMQKDVFVGGRNSYLLGKLLGLPIDQTANVGGGSVVGGVAIDGYLDIGLMDTMFDMLIESAGALVYAVIYAVGKGKFFVFLPQEKTVNAYLPPALSISSTEVAATEHTICES
jgi:hypothetical protein